MSVLFILTLSFLLVGMGWPCVQWLDRSQGLNSIERIAVAFLIGCYGVYIGVFSIGFFRLDALSMWILVGIFGLAAMPGIKQMSRSSHHVPLMVKLQIARSDPWAAVLWLLLILIGLSSILQGMAPPNDYDSLMYHLSNPQFDIEMGRLSVPWNRAIGTELFPSLAGHLSRLSLATMNAGVAQMLHGMLGLVTAVGASMLTIRMGYGRYAALLAAIFFLSTRVVIWEMGTVQVDVPLAAFTVLAIISYHSFRQSGHTGLAILFGLMIGGGILVKYHGFIVALAFAPLMLHDILRRRVPFVATLIIPIVALTTILPHLARNFLISGNPVYPLFNKLFNPGKIEFFAVGPASDLGTGKSFIDLLNTPWNMFISPMHLFDGMIFGAPFLLAFAPLLMLDPKNLRRWNPILAVAGCYFLGWFYLLDGQVRFLLPIMPVLASMAAVGVGVMWSSIGNYAILRAAFLSVAMILALNQALFVGIYSVLRLPVALGFMDPGTYHLKTPTMNGAFYETCGYIRANLKSGEKYFSYLQPHSFYCPQSTAIRTYFASEEKWWIKSNAPPPEPSLQAFIEKSEEAQLRYFVLPMKVYNRRNDTGKTIIKDADLSKDRYGLYMQPVLKKLTPLFVGTYTGVYDGPQVISGLKDLLKHQQN
jgi:hypothetical protein